MGGEDSHTVMSPVQNTERAYCSVEAIQESVKMRGQHVSNSLGFDLSFPRNEIEPWETDLEQVWESELPAWKDTFHPQHQDICGERGGTILESDQQKSLTGQRSISQIPDVDTNMNPVSYMLECAGDETEGGGPNFSLPSIEIDGEKLPFGETRYQEALQESVEMEGEDLLNLLQFDGEETTLGPRTNLASSTIEREEGRSNLSFPSNEIGPMETDPALGWELELPAWLACQPLHQDIRGERGGAILESDQRKSLTGQRSISEIPDMDTNMNPVSYMLECDGDETEGGGPNFSLPRNEIDGGKVPLSETVHPEPHQEDCAEMGVAALECDQWNSMTSEGSISKIPEIDTNMNPVSRMLQCDIDFAYNSPVTMNGASSTTEREGGPSFSSPSNEINREKVPLCETLGQHQYVYAEGGTEGTTESTLRIQTSDGKIDVISGCGELRSASFVGQKPAVDCRPRVSRVESHDRAGWLDVLLRTMSGFPEHDRARSLDVLLGTVSEPPERVPGADRQPIDPTPLVNVPCQESESFVGDLIGTVIEKISDCEKASLKGTGAASALRSLEELKGKVSSQNSRAKGVPSLPEAEGILRAVFGSLKTRLEGLFVGAQGQQHLLSSLYAMLELINNGVSMVDKLGNTGKWISNKLTKVMEDLGFRERFVGKVLQNCASSLSAIIPSKLKEHREKFISIDLLMGSFLDQGSGKIHHVGSGHRNGC